MRWAFHHFSKLLPLTAVAVWLWAVWPLLGRGFIPTHDGEYHIIRFYNFYVMLSQGFITPRWAPFLNSGYGLPLFNFHYPFANYVGSLFHLLGVSFVDSFKLALATGYGIAGVACFFWLRRTYSLWAATVGTIVFLCVPYWFVDIYVRGSIGEVFAVSWFMAALAAIAWKRMKLLTISIALLVISHNILAMIFTPILFFYAWHRTKREGVLASCLGVGVSLYFWLPALLERSFMTGLNIVQYRDYFADLAGLLLPSWGTGFAGVIGGNSMSTQLGLVPIAVWVWSGFVLWRRKNKDIVVTVVWISAIITVVLMLPISDVIWKTVTPLQFMQYPWRLLSLILPISALLAAVIVESLGKKRMSVVIAVLAVILSASYMRSVVYAPRTDTYYLTRANFTDGTSSIGNTFSTVWTPWKEVRPREVIEVLAGIGVVSEAQNSLMVNTFVVDAEQTMRLRIHRLYYPGWRVTVDGQPTTIDYKSNGTIDIDVSPGQRHVVIEFRETPLRLAADIGSLLCLFWWVGWAILDLIYARRSGYHPSHKRA